MPNEQDTEVDELNIAIAEDESVEDTQDTGNSEGESEDTKLDLETEEQPVDKRTPAEVNAQKQEDVWLQKVISGKSVIEDAPSWLQPRLTKRFNALNRVPETEEVVKKVIEAEREKSQFDEEVKSLPKMTAQEAQLFKARYAQLKPLGKLQALKLTKEYMGMDERTKEAEQRGVAKGRMSLPKSGQPAVRKSEPTVGGVPLSVVRDNKAWNQMIKAGRHSS